MTDHARDGSRKLLIALIIIASFAVVEVIGGLISGSLALLADAGHMVTDGTALALALFARQIAQAKPSPRFTFGRGRAQVLAAFVNALGLFLLIAFLLRESFERISEPQAINVSIMATVAVVGLLANLAAFAVLHGGKSTDVNLRGALLHVVGDILGSVAAIISAVVIYFTGLLVVDPLVTLLVCVLIGISAARLLRETAIILLEGVPTGIDERAVEREIRAVVPGVAGVHDFRVWMLTPETRQAALHVVVNDLADGNDNLLRIKQVLKTKFDIDTSTVQFEQAVPTPAGAPTSRAADRPQRPHPCVEKQAGAGGRLERVVPRTTPEPAL